MDCSMPGPPSLTISPSLPKLMSMNLDKAIILQLKKKKKEAKLFREKAQNGNATDTHVDENRVP